MVNVRIYPGVLGCFVPSAMENKDKIWHKSDFNQMCLLEVGMAHHSITLVSTDIRMNSR